MTKKTIITLFILLISILGCYYIQSSYQIIKKKSKEKIVEAFNEAIEIDKNSRFKQLNVPFLIGSSPQEASEYSTIKEDGKPTIKIKKTQRMKQLSSSEKINNGFQSYLHSNNPIKAETLDSIFQNELIKEIPDAQTYVCYTDNLNKRIFYSRKDTFNLDSGISTAKLNYGVRNEITLQGFAILPLSYIIYQGSDYFLTIILSWLTLILLLISAIKFLTKKKESTSESKIFISKNNEEPVFHIQITNSIFFDTSQYQLIQKNNFTPLTKQSGQILELLLKSPDKYLPYGVIINQLWGPIGDNGQERLMQAIKRLRENLEEFPSISIENIRGAGYRLYIKSAV